MTGRGARLAALAALGACALLAPALLLRFALTGAGAAETAAAVLAAAGAALWAGRLAEGAPEGRLGRARRRWAIPLSGLFLINGGVRTVTIANDTPASSPVVAVTHVVVVILSAALAVLLVGPTAERLVASLRAEG